MERKSLKCQICNENGVVDCYGKIFCLLHYYMNSNEPDKSHIISEIDYQEQKVKVEALWKEAISDVVVRMLDYEKIDQASISDDPLSILSLNAPRLSVLSLQSTRQRESSAETTKSSKKKQRRTNSNLSSTSSPPTPPLILSEFNQIQEVEKPINSSLIKGTRCPNCNSENTHVEYGTNNWSIGGGGGSSSSGGKDSMSTKGETWAFKDSPSAVTDEVVEMKNICDECGYVTIS